MNILPRVSQDGEHSPKGVPKVGNILPKVSLRWVTLPYIPQGGNPPVHTSGWVSLIPVIPRVGISHPRLFPGWSIPSVGTS